MKERPILFSSEMVKAILAGRKTQTRRIFKGMTPPDCEGVHSCVIEDGFAKFDLNGRLAMHEGEWTKCPYNVEERLWVRETFAASIPGCPNGISYRADHQDQNGDGPANPIKWKPSIFMPRWASRITLEITGVRVERLQGITGNDIIAEGVDFPVMHVNERGKPFRDLWDSINGKRASWESNPWVWVVEFRIEATGLPTVEAA